jgi:hypothetical protein
LNTHVQVELVDGSGGCELLEFDVVRDEQADFAHGFLGEGTRLAQAIMGQPAGSRLPYRAGEVAQVRVVSVAPSTRAPSDDVAAKRQAVLEQAVAEADRAAEMAFALAVGSKWGDYDPGAVKE